MTEVLDEAQLPLLHCMDGGRAPTDMHLGMQALDNLAPGAREHFDALLEAALPVMPDDQLENRIGRLCRRHELSLENTMVALKTARFFLHSAAQMALETEKLAEDLTAVQGGTLGCELVLRNYEKHRAGLRELIARSTVAGHGKVLTGVEWRIDTMGSSNRGRNINLPVATLTFHHQEGAQQGRTTIQLLPDSVMELYEVCRVLLDK